MISWVILSMYGSQNNNLTVPIDAAYHQMITNRFRSLWPYGSGGLDKSRWDEVFNQVYKEYPLP